MKTFNLSSLTKRAFAVLGLAAIVAASSCKKDDDGYDFDGTIVSHVQLYNASTDAGSVSLYIHDFLRTPTPVVYGTTSGYNQTYAATGETINVKNASGQSIANTSMTLNADYSYSFYLVGKSGAYSLLVSDDTQAAPASGKAKVRFINAMTGSTSTNVTLGGADFGTVAVNGLSDYKEVTAGASAVRLNFNIGSNAAVLNQNLTFESGKIYTVVAKGTAGTTGDTAVGITLIQNNLSPKVF